MTSDNFRETLRIKAKKKLADMPDKLKDMDKKEVYALFEELNIHQIEIELQNEELIAIQRSLENSRYRYMNLFDNAPVGYVVLDQVGIIKHYNTTFLNMVQHRKLKQSGQAFADLLIETDAETFRARYKAFFKAPEGKQIQARLIPSDPHPVSVLLEGRHHLEHIKDTRSAHELLLTVSDISELQLAKQQFKDAFHSSKRKENEISALLMAARAVLEKDEFQTVARAIFDICASVIGSTSGYIAMLSKDGDENEVLFLEDGGLPCTVDPDLPMPIRGLREQAYETCQVVYSNNFMDSDWTKFLPRGHVHMANVLFAPLVIEQKVVGVMGLANKKSDFNDHDALIAKGFGEIAAIAFKNARLQDKRQMVENEKSELIERLQSALANVKQLSGLLPICSHCKKIRDDKGYWNQIEDYLDTHSEAKFSHGICQDCAKLHYPDFNLYED